jgi:hypothetical protein
VLIVKRGDSGRGALPGRAIGAAMKRTILLALLLACGTARAASAPDLPPDWNTVRHYAEMRRYGAERELLIATYLAGAGSAFVTANAQLKLTIQPGLFCPPDGLVLSALNFVGIFDAELARWGPKPPDTIQDTSDAIVLLAALQRTFPCASSDAGSQVSADIFTLSCRLEDPGNPSFGVMPTKVTFQVRIDEAKKSATKNNNETLSANISGSQISFRDRSPSGDAWYVIDRSSGDITVAAANGMGLLAGHCSKVVPEHRAF